MKKFTLQISLLTLSALFSCNGGTEAHSQEIYFSAIPDQNSTELVEKYNKIANYLASELEIAVTYVPSSDYSASVEAFKSGDVQLAWFGGLTGIRARAAVTGARAIAQGKIDPEFKSYFIAHKDAGLTPSADFPQGLAGKTFTFGSESSTSGRLMPEYWIREESGKSPQELFAGEEMSFSGDHAKTATLVQAGTFEAGVLNYRVYDALVAAGKIDPKVCIKIWETPTYPDYNWTAHPDLGEELIERLQAALIGMSDPELLAAAQRTEGIIAASNEDFAPLESLARDLNLLR
ncbi:MAG: putative selenate ABC transporter substrate-binding protein [Planctomycetota bacterium]|nr:putative selenate ABC transporter substrate-binding protein [Planctomycetota bacterium]